MAFNVFNVNNEAPSPLICHQEIQILLLGASFSEAVNATKQNAIKCQTMETSGGTSASTKIDFFLIINKT